MHKSYLQSVPYFQHFGPPGQAATDLLMQIYIYSERLERPASNDLKFRLEICSNYKNVCLGPTLALPDITICEENRGVPRHEKSDNFSICFVSLKTLYRSYSNEPVLKKNL